MDSEYHMTTLRLPKDTVLKLKMQAGLERKSMTSLINEHLTKPRKTSVK